MKKSSLFVIVIIIVCVIVGGAVSVSLALWRETQFGNIDIINEDEINPSARYLIYKPLDNEYNILELEEYNLGVHGNIEYSNTTSLNYLVYHYSLNTYTIANNDEIIAGTDLYVYSNDAVYDPALHGNKVYYSITDDGYQLFYNDGGYVEADAATVSQMMIDAGDTLVAGMFYVYPEETYIDIFVDNSYGTIYCSSVTNTGYQIYYIEDETKTIATAEQMSAGINLYVNEYEAYAQIDHGIFMLNSYTTNGQYVYYKNEDDDYIEPTQSMLIAGTNLNVCESAIFSYAVVGYYGIIPEVAIPLTYTPTDSAKEYFISRVCAYSGAMDYAFNGNSLITSLIISNSVVSLGDAVFADMVNLQRVELKGAFETLIVGDYAFLGCYNLSIFVSERTLRDKYDVAVDFSHNAFIGCTSLP